MTPDSDGIDPGLQAPAEPDGLLARGIPAWVWALLVLLPCVSFSFWMTAHSQSRSEDLREAVLGDVAAETRVALVERLHAYEMLLRSVQTVFLASDQVTATEFSDTFRNLRSRTEFPELQALAYARREVVADSERFVTVMAVPVDGEPPRAGLDLASGPDGLVDLQAARDRDQVVMSPRLPLWPDADESRQQGMRLVLPIYSPGSPPQDPGERRARMMGALAASIHADRLIAGVIPSAASQGLHIMVSDVTDGAPLLLYDSHPTRSSQEAATRLAGKASDNTGSTRTPPADAPQARPARFDQEISFGGRRWLVGSRPLTPRNEAFDWGHSAFWTGLLISALLAMLVWSVASTRSRALALGQRMSHRYRESEQRFRILNDLLPALVLMADPEDGRILYANEAAAARLGGGIADGVSLDALFEHESERKRLLLPPGQPHPSQADALLVSLNGDRFWASISMTRVEVGDLERLLIVANDISEQRQLTELLRYQASHDTLTELFNRREFERRLMRVLEAAGDAPAAALLYIDLDQFKLINDTSGHLAGDQLLSQLGLAMAGQLREGDVLARLGGDEFGILAHGVDAEAALGLAERVRVRVEEHIYVWAQRSYTISASIGVVMIDHAGLSLGEVLSNADSACYMAKDYGRNRIHLFSEDDLEAVRRRGEMEWANRLRWVIEEERLLIDYQEIQPLQQQAGDPHIELLLRLRDEDGRVVLPGAFLPAAERYGMVAQLDRWVIAQAIAHFDQLHASGRAPGRCSLNLSAATLEDHDLADYVLGLIEKYGVDPSRLCFEITETVAVRDLARAVRFIERLRGVGCQVALDDFGAGMSSFGYLKNLPVDVIKIDGSFIRDLDEDPMNRTIVDAIAKIGHQRGFDVVAEWVTTTDAAATLRELGVDYGQGFALHRPEPVLYQRGQRQA